MIPPDVVKATVGETVTAVTVVSVVSVLLHVMLVAHELDCAVLVVVKVESLLVTGSNCKIKQIRLTIDSYLSEHHRVITHAQSLESTKKKLKSCFSRTFSITRLTKLPASINCFLTLPMERNSTRVLKLTLFKPQACNIGIYKITEILRPRSLVDRRV